GAGELRDLLREEERREEEEGEEKAPEEFAAGAVVFEALAVEHDPAPQVFAQPRMRPEAIDAEGQEREQRYLEPETEERTDAAVIGEPPSAGRLRPVSRRGDPA